MNTNTTKSEQELCNCYTCRLCRLMGPMMEAGDIKGVSRLATTELIAAAKNIQSLMGDNQDIDHGELEAMRGEVIGNAARIMRALLMTMGDYDVPEEDAKNACTAAVAGAALEADPFTVYGIMGAFADMEIRGQIERAADSISTIRSFFPWSMLQASDSEKNPFDRKFAPLEHVLRVLASHPVGSLGVEMIEAPSSSPANPNPVYVPGNGTIN